jgi:hypothetical protein
MTDDKILFIYVILANEIKNGRLAMLAISGILTQQVSHFFKVNFSF